MKILSNTDTGGRVVEFTKDEFRELFLLAKSCDPQVLDERDVVWEIRVFRGGDTTYDEINDFDFTKALENVRAFREAQFNINKIRNLIDGIERSMKK